MPNLVLAKEAAFAGQIQAFLESDKVCASIRDPGQIWWAYHCRSFISEEAFPIDTRIEDDTSLEGSPAFGLDQRYVARYEIAHLR